MGLYDYRCVNGHTTEKRADRNLQHIICPECGEAANRVAVYQDQYIFGETVAKGGSRATREGNIKDKYGRTRVSVFQEASAEIDYAHTKAENEVGCELPHPDLYKRALRRAATENKVSA
jgi:hypothetical protein